MRFRLPNILGFWLMEFLLQQLSQDRKLGIIAMNLADFFPSRYKLPVKFFNHLVHLIAEELVHFS